MYKIISFLFFTMLFYQSTAQSNWFLEAEIAGGLLSKSFEDVKTAENAPDIPPIPFTPAAAISLYKKINANLSIGLGLDYQIDRNAKYFTTYPNTTSTISPQETGYLSSWNYLNLPLSFRYNITTRWFMALQLSNAFLVSKSERYISKNNGSSATKQERFAYITSNERFHALGLSIGYSIPFKNGHNLLLKGFYDYVILSSMPTSADNETIPNQYGISLVYQIPNLFQRKIK